MRFSKKGFTLIEILITITVFSIIITAALSLFGSAFRYQRESLAKAYLLNNASYITEYASRALRMAKKDLSGSCIGAGNNFATTTDEIKFLNYNNECQRFFLEDSIFKVEKLGIVQTLSPSNLVVEDLDFVVSGQSQEDETQPKVTFCFKLKSSGQEIKVQTTVSQRDLDVQY